VRRLFLAALAMLSASSAYAYQFEGTQTMALGGSGRALVTGNDAINLNPAGLAWAELYSLEASARDDLRGSDTWFNTSIMDSQAGPIAGGVSYTYIDRLAEDGTKTQLGHQLDFALATKLTSSMSLGVTARYLNGDESTEDSGYQLFTIDAGYQLRLSQGLSLGLVVYNVTDTGRSTAPLTYGGGLSYGSDSFGLHADIYFDANTNDAKYLFGLAYLLSANFPLRLGTNYNESDESVFVSGGIGYQTAGLSADLSYQQRVDAGKNMDENIGDRQLAASLRLSFF